MPTLFTIEKDSDITKQMVDDFCALGFKEAIRVDYKQDFPSDLSKTLAAFANTTGGLVIIGVAADDENRPKVPIRGIPFQRGLEERVYQICSSSIHPPLLPDVWVVRFDDREIPPSERAVLVIRVLESDDKLHAVEGRTGIYFRTGNISSPFQRADIEDLSNLLQKRELAVEKRAKLMTQSHSRFDFLFSEHATRVSRGWPEGQRSAIEAQVRRRPITKISCVPLFPRTPFAPCKLLIKHLETSKCERRDSNVTSQFPSGRTWRPTQNGALNQSSNLILELVDVSEFGSVVFFGDNPMDTYPLRSNSSELSMQIDPSYLGRTILAVWALALKLLQSFEFFGSIELALKICGLRGHYLIDPHGPRCPDDMVEYSVNSTPSLLKEHWNSTFTAFMERLYWAFGNDYPYPDNFRREAELSWDLNFGQS